ncbi:hypothetical protein EDD86DRAFT_144932 [Gorgonomyces haynaldii]|nr:hypothetical protein EDD86DRAFT_144932 [Gorgonomyces haynaldii]
MNLAVEPKAQGTNPNDRMCYICGRNFGTASIGIHEQKCIEKWHLEQSKFPKSQRKPLPQKPVIDQSIPRTAKEEAEQYNELANQTFLDQARDECPNCARKFLPDRLLVHLKSCKADPKAKPKNVLLQCSSGHRVKATDKFCSECGDKLGQ